MVARFDLNASPDIAPLLAPGDELWVDHTLYVVERLEGSKAILKRHEPIKIRRLPEGKSEVQK